MSEEDLERICRRIMLYHLDRGWADHLAYLRCPRKHSPARAGPSNPLDEFHRMAVDAFGNLAADAIEAAQQTFETANVLDDEPGLDLSKLARPTSTWTYMVHDNPLRDDTLSALSLPGVFRQVGNRVWTIPNILSMIRLVLLPVFAYLLLARHPTARRLPS